MDKSLYERAQRAYRRNTHKCTNCGERLPDGWKYVRCEMCNRIDRMRKKIGDRAKLNIGKCTRCNAKLPKNHPYTKCRKCLDELNRRQKERRHMLVAQGKCLDCGAVLDGTRRGQRCGKCYAKRKGYNDMTLENAYEGDP